VSYVVAKCAIIRNASTGQAIRWVEAGYSAGSAHSTVADAFDAITTNRPYKKKKTVEEAIQEIKRCSGTQFDPVVVGAFLLSFEKGNIITTGTHKFPAP
jgi:hypothetical protein